ncbi:hypothetical protein B0A49_10099 [Cryomyces minteri]|uniref:Amino acid permease/ SLC12A domain-containing protein n=1 Tax=Cryomyces minteri TaxID=331657 RepID=A0A4U0WU02_9PEZI|nr:hypothetical protein B0A49_10099 [Cryomyces minteri]
MHLHIRGRQPGVSPPDASLLSALREIASSLLAGLIQSLLDERKGPTVATFDAADYQRVREALERDHQRIDDAPTAPQRLGRFTVVCLVMNRTIGAGVFVTPSIVLKGTGSVGASLLLWASGGIIAACGLLVWLELGLSLPIHNVPGTDERKSAPRSGGEKNYLEYMFPKPKFLVTCMYGIVFILLGNLSGNAIILGTYIMKAAGHQPDKGGVIGIAIGALTVAVLLHMSSRRGGIWVNNFFAVLKVLILVMIIILGFVKAGGADLGEEPKATNNFDSTTSFSGFDTEKSRNVASYAVSLLYIIYTYSGFEQPFYVLSEVRNPRKVFPKYTLIAILLTTILFVLVNIAYLCVVQMPMDKKYLDVDDMATVFFQTLFREQTSANRAMAALIALSIFGNIVVMTFTASRVKQEIAKEGILPRSLFFASGHTSPWAWAKARWQAKGIVSTPYAIDTHLEQTPMAALCLHWFTSVFLVAVTSSLKPAQSYNVLISLYSYVMIVLMGFVVSGGLLYLKFKPQHPQRHWSASYKPWLDPVHALVYFLVCGFVLFAALAKPAEDSPYSASTWFIVPTVGLSTITWGLFWYLGLRIIMVKRREKLIVTRLPFLVQDDDDKNENQWIQKSELVDHEWHTYSKVRSDTRKRHVVDGEEFENP